MPGVILPGIMFNLLALYPTLEAWSTKDKALPQPAAATAGHAGAHRRSASTALTFYGVLFIGGQNDILANTFHWSLQATSWVLRALLFLAPPMAFYITKRICLGLQHHDEELLHHGFETGIIRRLPSGEYIEVTRRCRRRRRRCSRCSSASSITPTVTARCRRPTVHGANVAPNGTPRRPRRPSDQPAGPPLARARASIESFFFERHEPPRDNPEDDEPKTLATP